MPATAMSQRDREITRLSTMIDAQIAEVAQKAAKEAETAPALHLAQPRRRPLASPKMLIGSWLVCLVLTVVNLEFGGLFMPRNSDPEPFELISGLEISAALDGIAIEAYQAENGILPLGLAEVGLPDDDPTREYQRLDGGAFRVIARHGRFEGIYDSRDAAARRTEAARARALEAQRREEEREERLAEAEQWLIEAEAQAEARRGQARDDHRMETYR